MDAETEMETSEAEGLECEACGRTFDSRAALERHVREVGLVD